jgi:uncharacterized lipoprotein YbaY
MNAKTLWLYATAGLLSIILAGCAAPKNESSVTGTLTYLERIALPENAEISVQLQDVSRADAPAIIIGEEKFLSGGKQVPFPFEVKYDPAEIIENHNYVVRGEIRVDGTLVFTTTQAYLVITRGNPTSGLELILSKVN